MENKKGEIKFSSKIFKL